MRSCSLTFHCWLSRSLLHLCHRSRMGGHFLLRQHRAQKRLILWKAYLVNEYLLPELFIGLPFAGTFVSRGVYDALLQKGDSLSWSLNGILVWRQIVFGVCLILNYSHLVVAWGPRLGWFVLLLQARTLFVEVYRSHEILETNLHFLNAQHVLECHWLFLGFLLIRCHIWRITWSHRTHSEANIAFIESTSMSTNPHILLITRQSQQLLVD